MVAEGVDILSTDGSQVSCMWVEDVQVLAPASQGRQTRTSQRATIDRAESSRARCRDDKDDNDADADDINDPTYDQDELTRSQLADAPQGTKTQVRVSLPSSTWGCYKGVDSTVQLCAWNKVGHVFVYLLVVC